MGFKSDIEIAQESEMLPITQIAEKAGIDDKYLEQYGKYKAKIDYNLLKDCYQPDSCRRRKDHHNRRPCRRYAEAWQKSYGSTP